MSTDGQNGGATRGRRAARASGFALDLRQALRRLRRSPALVAAAALALGVGAAAVAAVAHVAQVAFLTPLGGIERQEELVNLDLVEPRSLESGDAPLALVDELGELDETLGAVAGFVGGGVALRGAPELPTELAVSQFVTRDYFALLGVRAAHGRLLDPARVAEPEVVLADRTFRRWFGGDPRALGRTIEIGGRPFTVVGVTPPGFDGTFVGFPFAAYLSIESGRSLLPEKPSVELIGRLAPGVTLDAARTRLAALAPVRATDGTGRVVRPRTLDGLDPSIAKGLAALVAALAALALVVLGTAAANVGGLLAARAVERRGELALRSALGAPGRRLLRPLLLEASLLGLAGGVAAMTLVVGALALMSRLVPRFSVPLAIDLTPSMAVVAAAVALAWLLGSAAGLAPAIAVGSAGRLTSAFGHADRLIEAIGFGRGARRTRRMRSAFVVGQLALALVLVAAGVALGRGVAGADEFELGFEPDTLRALELETPVVPGDAATRLALATAIERRARESGAVAAAGLVDHLPFAFGRPTVETLDDAGATGPELDSNSLTPGALDALGLALVEGRDFRADDVSGALPVAIVDRAAAERLWPDGGHLGYLGRRVRLAGESGDAFLEVVGVTAPARLHRPWLASRGQLFRPLAQFGGGRLALVVKSRESATGLDRTLLPELAAIAPELPLDRFVPMVERVDLVQLPQRIAGRVASTLSAVAVALAALGLAGLVARMANERRREFSIRAALGADTRSIARLVLGEGVRLAAIGAALGLPLAVAVGFALASALERVSPADPSALAVSAGAVALLALAAAAWPAWRASRAAPADILRGD